jgi:hypothetical protein
MWSGDALGAWAKDDVLPVGAFVELVPVMDATFLPLPTTLYFTHKYFREMRRLARDETPFPLVMQPRVTALAW